MSDTALITPETCLQSAASPQPYLFRIYPAGNRHTRLHFGYNVSAGTIFWISDFPDHEKAFAPLAAIKAYSYNSPAFRFH